MNAAVKLTFQNFLIIFVPLFLTIWAIPLILDQRYGGFSDLLSFFLLLATGFTTFHLIRHILEVKKLHDGKLTEEDFQVRQQLDLELPVSKDQILEKLQRSSVSRNWEIRENDNIILIRTPMSEASIGEKILIKVEDHPNAHKNITVISQPLGLFNLIKISFFDYGRNQKNILYLQKLLTA